jgi:hypothetical protein
MTETILPLWEILVPTVHNNGKPFRTRFHKVWDAKVRAITGGLTIFKPAFGQWKSDEGTVFVERMIPVRIACTREQIQLISDFAAQHYEQLAIMFYLVSEEVHIVSYDPAKKFKRKKGEPS